MKKYRKAVRHRQFDGVLARFTQRSFAKGVALVTVLIIGVPKPVTAQEKTVIADDSAALAQKLANPIAGLVSVPIKLNWNSGIDPSDAKRSTYVIQPAFDWGALLYRASGGRGGLGITFHSDFHKRRVFQPCIINGILCGLILLPPGRDLRGILEAFAMGIEGSRNIIVEFGGN